MKVDLRLCLVQQHIYKKNTNKTYTAPAMHGVSDNSLSSHLTKHCRQTILWTVAAPPPPPLAGVVTQALGVAAVMAVSYRARYDPIQFSRPSEPSLPTVQLPSTRQWCQDGRTGCRPFADPSRDSRQPSQFCHVTPGSRHSSVT